MIEWKKRRVSRVRLNKLFDLVDECVPDDKVRRTMKKRIMEILYLAQKDDAVSKEDSVAEEFSSFNICG